MWANCTRYTEEKSCVRPMTEFCLRSLKSPFYCAGMEQGIEGHLDDVVGVKSHAYGSEGILELSSLDGIDNGKENATTLTNAAICDDELTNGNNETTKEVDTSVAHCEHVDEESGYAGSLTKPSDYVPTSSLNTGYNSLTPSESLPEVNCALSASYLTILGGLERQDCTESLSKDSANTAFCANNVYTDEWEPVGTLSESAENYVSSSSRNLQYFLDSVFDSVKDGVVNSHLSVVDTQVVSPSSKNDCLQNVGLLVSSSKSNLENIEINSTVLESSPISMSDNLVVNQNHNVSSAGLDVDLTAQPGPSGINGAIADESSSDSGDSVVIVEKLKPKAQPVTIVLSDDPTASEDDEIVYVRKANMKSRNKNNAVASKKGKGAKNKSRTPQKDTIKEKLEEKKQEIFSMKPDPEGGKTTPVDTKDFTCSICLSEFENRAFLDECFHSFCYTCILQWAEVVKQCPLCKATFKSLIHSVTSDLDYKQHFLGDVGAADQSTASAALVDLVFNEIMEDGRRFRYRSTMSSDVLRDRELREQRMLEEQRRASLKRRRRYQKMREQRNSASVERRRMVYRLGMVIKEIKTHGRPRERDVSVEFIRNNPASTHRLVGWLLRDIRVLLGQSEEHVNFLMHLILGLITRVSMDSNEFYEQLQPFFMKDTRQFIQELISFAKSPYDIEAYDANVVYDMPPIGTTRAGMTASLMTDNSQSRPSVGEDQAPDRSTVGCDRQSTAAGVIQESPHSSGAVCVEESSRGSHANAVLSDDSDDVSVVRVIAGNKRKTSKRGHENDSESKTAGRTETTVGSKPRDGSKSEVHVSRDRNSSSSRKFYHSDNTDDFWYRSRSEWKRGTRKRLEGRDSSSSSLERSPHKYARSLSRQSPVTNAKRRDSFSSGQSQVTRRRDRSKSASSSKSKSERSTRSREKIMSSSTRGHRESSHEHMSVSLKSKSRSESSKSDGMSYLATDALSPSASSGEEKAKRASSTHLKRKRNRNTKHASHNKDTVVMDTEGRSDSKTASIAESETTPRSKHKRSRDPVIRSGSSVDSGKCLPSRARSRSRTRSSSLSPPRRKKASETKENVAAHDGHRDNVSDSNTTPILSPSCKHDTVHRDRHRRNGEVDMFTNIEDHTTSHREMKRHKHKQKKSKHKKSHKHKSRERSISALVESNGDFTVEEDDIDRLNTESNARTEEDILEEIKQLEQEIVKRKALLQKFTERLEGKNSVVEE